MYGFVLWLAEGAADRHSSDGSGRSARGAPVRAAGGLVVERDRIEVRYAGAKEAVVKLVALALALNNDYERFERSWRGRGHRDERGPGSGGHPAAGRARRVGGRGAAVGIVDAGPVAVERFLEFFAAQVANTGPRRPSKRIWSPAGSRRRRCLCFRAWTGRAA